MSAPNLDIRFYNALTHSVEPFMPIEPGKVRMYNCGPTVYDFAHIGNFRAFVFADLLRRFLEFAGYDVTQVMNITDVGHMTQDQLADGGGQDKMELAAERLKAAKKQGVAEVENPNDPYQVAAYFADAFVADARALRLKIADDPAQQMPHATEYVAQMIELVKTLIEKGHAYATDDGAVYYDVQSFPQYGRLSGNTLDKLHSGAGGRVADEDQAGKRHPADFLLWKRDERHLMKWDSPWGTGYPGWHIECSAMAMSVHGTPTIDIHTGGEDNIFPHHECEIAQSTGATDKPFANWWMHTRFLLVEGEKMSKSKGNFFTVRDLIEKRDGERVAHPAALRLQLLRTHYRANMNFTMKGLEDSRKDVEKLREFAGQVDTRDESLRRMGNTDVERRFMTALADDLNISAALGELFKWMGEVATPTEADRRAVQRLDSVLGVLGRVLYGEVRETIPATSTATATAKISDEWINAQIEKIAEARAAKDYARSDALRDELTAAGIEVQITKDGISWRRKMRLE